MENAYFLAYKRSYRKLLLVLPIDALIPLIKDKDSLTRVVANNGATREERSRCLLEFVMEELKEGRVTSFEQLLEVMEGQVDASNDTVVDRVLRSIRMDVKGTYCTVLFIGLVKTMDPNTCFHNTLLHI